MGKDDGNKYLDSELINDEEILDHIVSKVTFKAQKQSVKRGWNLVFRKGVKGDYKNYFNPPQEQMIDDITRIKFHGMPNIRYYKSDRVIRSKL